MSNSLSLLEDVLKQLVQFQESWDIYFSIVKLFSQSHYYLHQWRSINIEVSLVEGIVATVRRHEGGFQLKGLGIWLLNMLLLHIQDEGCLKVLGSLRSIDAILRIFLEYSGHCKCLAYLLRCVQLKLVTYAEISNSVVNIADQLPLPIKYANFMDLFKFAVIGLQQDSSSSPAILTMLQTVIPRAERSHKAVYNIPLVWPTVLSNYLQYEDGSISSDFVTVLGLLSYLHDTHSMELYSLGAIDKPLCRVSQVINGSVSITDSVIEEIKAILDYLKAVSQQPDILLYVKSSFGPQVFSKLIGIINSRSTDMYTDKAVSLRLVKLLASVCDLFSLLNKTQRETSTARSRLFEIAEFLKGTLVLCHKILSKCSFSSDVNSAQSSRDRSTLTMSPFFADVNVSGIDASPESDNPRLLSCSVLYKLSRSFNFIEFSELKDILQLLRTVLFTAIDEADTEQCINELDYVDGLSSICGYQEYCFRLDQAQEDTELLAHCELVNHVVAFTTTSNSPYKSATAAAASPSTALAESSFEKVPDGTEAAIPACGDVNCIQSGCMICARDSEDVKQKEQNDVISISVKFASSSALPVSSTIPIESTFSKTSPIASQASSPGNTIHRVRSKSFDVSEVSALRSNIDPPSRDKYLSSGDMSGTKYVGIKLMIKCEDEIKETLSEWAQMPTDKFFHALTMLLVIGETAGIGILESLVDVRELGTILHELLTDDRLGLEVYPSMLPKVLQLLTFISHESATFYAGGDISKVSKRFEFPFAASACEYAIGLFSSQDYWGNEYILYHALSLITALCPHDRQCRRAVVKSFAKICNAFTRLDRVSTLQPLLKLVTRLQDCIGKIDVNGDSEGIEALLSLLITSLHMYRCNYNDIALAACLSVGAIGAEYPGLAHRVFMRRELEDVLALFLKQGGIGRVTCAPLRRPVIDNGVGEDVLGSPTRLKSASSFAESNPHILPVMRACIVCIKDVHANPFWMFTGFGTHWLAYAEGLAGRALLSARALSWIVELISTCDVRYRLLVLTASLEYATALMFNCCDGNLSRPFLGQNPEKIIDFSSDLKAELIKQMLPLIPKALNIIISRDNSKVISVKKTLREEDMINAIGEVDLNGKEDKTFANGASSTSHTSSSAAASDESASKKKKGLMKSMQSSLSSLKNPFSKKKDSAAGSDDGSATPQSTASSSGKARPNATNSGVVDEAGPSSAVGAVPAASTAGPSAAVDDEATNKKQKKSALAFSKEVILSTNKLLTGAGIAGTGKGEKKLPSSSSSSNANSTVTGTRNSMSSIRPSLYRSWSATAETTVNRALEALTEKTVDAIYSFFCLQDMFPVSVYLMNIKLFERTPICACLAYSMSSYPENFIIQQRGIEVFRTFAENKTELSSLGMHASTSLLIALKKFDDHAKLQQSYCKVIKILAASDDFARDNLIRYSVQNGLASILLKDNAETAVLALQALRGLAVTSSEASCVAEESNIISAILRALDSFANDVRVQIEGLFALIALSETNEFIEVMSASNSESILKKSKKMLMNVLKTQKPLPADYNVEDIQELLDDQQLAGLNDKCVIS